MQILIKLLNEWDPPKVINHVFMIFEDSEVIEFHTKHEHGTDQIIINKKDLDYFRKVGY